MTVQDLYRVLVDSQFIEISKPNMGEINNMYSPQRLPRGSIIVINFKKNYTRGWREDMQCALNF